MHRTWVTLIPGLGDTVIFLFPGFHSFLSYSCHTVRPRGRLCGSLPDPRSSQGAEVGHHLTVRDSDSVHFIFLKRVSLPKFKTQFKSLLPLELLPDQFHPFQPPQGNPSPYLPSRSTQNPNFFNNQMGPREHLFQFPRQNRISSLYQQCPREIQCKPQFSLENTFQFSSVTF